MEPGSPKPPGRPRTALAFKTMRDLATLRSLALANAKNHHISPETFTAVFEATMKVFLDKIFDETTNLLVEIWKLWNHGRATDHDISNIVAP